MCARELQLLPFDRVKLCSAPFIQENPKRWTWRSVDGPDHYNLWICRSGHAKFRFLEGDEQYEVKPWTVLMIPRQGGVSWMERRGCAGL